MSKLKYIGNVELQPLEEHHHFEIYKSKKFLKFGSHCNTGFIEHGKYEIDKDFSLDENLEELINDLECAIEHGINYCSDSFESYHELKEDKT